MARFYYVAQDKDRNLERGDIEGKDRKEAIDILIRRGLTPIKFEVVNEGEGTTRTRSFFSHTLSFGGRLTTFDQVTIIRHLGTILHTGTDLLTALEIIARDSIKPLTKRILYDIKERVARGEHFSETIRVWQEQFDPVFVNLIRAAEASGNLPTVLLSYAKELRKDMTFMRKLRGAMVYPVILISALTAMIVLILAVVIPRFKELFVSLKAEPPLYTKIFFFASDVLLAYTVPLVTIVVILFIVVFFAFRHKRLRRQLGLLVWHLPVLRTVAKNLTLLRFSKTVANLLEGGFSLKAALLVAGEVVSPNYERALREVAEKKLEEGVSFAEALGRYPRLFPEVLVSVIATGERTGQLSAVLLEMAEFYEEEIIYSMELLLTLIEPVLLLIVGLIIGLLAGSLIGPIYRLIGRF